MFSVLPAKLLPERYNLYGNSLEFKLNKMIEKNWKRLDPPNDHLKWPDAPEDHLQEIGFSR